MLFRSPSAPAETVALETSDWPEPSAPPHDDIAATSTPPILYPTLDPPEAPENGHLSPWLNPSQLVGRLIRCEIGERRTVLAVVRRPSDARYGMSRDEVYARGYFYDVWYLISGGAHIATKSLRYSSSWVFVQEHVRVDHDASYDEVVKVLRSAARFERSQAAVDELLGENLSEITCTTLHQACQLVSQRGGAFAKKIAASISQIEEQYCCEFVTTFQLAIVSRTNKKSVTIAIDNETFSKVSNRYNVFTRNGSPDHATITKHAAESVFRLQIGRAHV